MAPIRRVVVDLLKPHEPPEVEFVLRVAEADGVAGVNATLIEIDKEVQNLKLTVEGEDVDYAAVVAAIEELGGTVHSVDQVACGDYIVEETATPQD